MNFFRKIYRCRALSAVKGMPTLARADATKKMRVRVCVSFTIIEEINNLHRVHISQLDGRGCRNALPSSLWINLLGLTKSTVFGN